MEDHNITVIRRIKQIGEVVGIVIGFVIIGVLSIGFCVQYVLNLARRKKTRI